MIKVRFNLLLGKEEGDEQALYKDEQMPFEPMPGLILITAIGDNPVDDFKVAKDPEYKWDSKEQLLHVKLESLYEFDNSSLSFWKEDLLEQGWKRE